MEPRMVTQPQNVVIRKPKGKFPKWARTVLIVLLVLVGLGGILGGLGYSAGMKVKASLMEAKTHAQAAYDGLKAQNLEIAKTELDAAKTKITEARSAYGSIALYKFTPFAWHYRDGEHVFAAMTAAVEAGELLVSAVEPYADVIGFKGQGSFVGGTAEDRIVKIIETVDKINPSLDAVTAKLDIINAELGAINPKRYPFISVQGQSVAGLIAMGQEKVSQADSLLAQFRPAIGVLPQIAGLTQPQRYLVLFQNDAELRPTGSFMTAYAVLKVEKGKVTPEKSSDIYDLDNQFKKRIEAPAIITKLLKVPVWHLRDMNLSPDFKTSMNQFVTHYNQLPGVTKVDGVIAVDTQVLTDLVSILGPIDVPGFGTFKSDIDRRCDCPQVLYALEEIADKPTSSMRTDRKAVLGPLMQAILTRAYGAPKQQWPGLFTSIWKNMNEKHVLMYYFNEDFQTAAETINVAGRIKDYSGDYLHVNDANFGGAKSNMFVTQTVDQEIVKNGNSYDKTITISYKNPRKSDNCNLEAGQLCLNGKMPSWVRIYLPANAEVGEVLGLDSYSVTDDADLNKKGVEGVYTLMPESQVKIKLTVKVPAGVNDGYKLFIQKQPGTKASPYTVTLSGTQQNFELVSDKEVTIK